MTQWFGNALAEAVRAQRRQCMRQKTLTGTGRYSYSRLL